jgi:hypothetical protein
VANAVVDAINAAVSDERTRLAMLMGSYLESGWNASSVGDNGTSFGPFQMHIGGALTSSGLSPEQAKNPELATRAMLGEYQGAVNKVSDSLWNSNPRQAAALAAYYAERPAQMYPSARINEAWRAMTSGGGGGIIGTAKGIAGNIGGLFTGSTEGKIGAAIGGAAQSTGEKVVGAIWNTVGAKVLFVGLGLGLVGLGAYQTFKPQLRAAGDRAAELGGIAAKVGA